MQGGGLGLSADRSSFLSDLMDTIVARGRTLLNLRHSAPAVKHDLVQLSSLLLSQRGEASGVALAQALLEGYRAAADGERRLFRRVALKRSARTVLGPIAIENYRSRGAMTSSGAP
jgi:hypothetical protein